MEKLGSRLGELHLKRVSADYKMADKAIENQQSSRSAVQHATEMTQTLENCAIYSDRWKEIRKAILRVEKL